ncbi:MAG: T9SS type A sorting domain-containing protein [Candidatus Azobacteroides sp.]|nr:T9SS type A sorting domain-containing protein [Candidatus Azobacteroides sp.]
MKKQFFTLLKGCMVLLFLFCLGIHAHAETEKRYYIINSTELPTGENLECVDYRVGNATDITINSGIATQFVQDTDYNYLYFERTGSGWWSFDVVVKEGETLAFPDVDENWVLNMKIRTTCTHSPINVIFYLHNTNAQFKYEVTAADLPDRSGTEFMTLTLPLSGFGGIENPFPTTITNYFFAIHADQSGVDNMMIAIDEVYLSNQGISTPEPPTPPADPEIKRYYIISSSDLPQQEDMLCVDYRVGTALEMEVRQMVQDDDYAYPYFDIPEGSWWSFNTKPMAGNTLDFTDVDENWSLRFNLQTNVPYSPINVIFFNGNKQFYYELTEETFPERSGAEFTEMSIPLKDFILEDDAVIPFPGTYTEGQQFFTLHANEGEGSGLFVAIDDVYLTNEESDPDGPNPPVDPDDPDEKRYYIVSSSTLPTLAEGIQSIDYRIGNVLNIAVNQMTQDPDYDYLYFNKPTSGWWSFDSRVNADTSIEFEDVDEKWSLNLDLKTNMTVSPINLIFFNGSAHFKYEVTEQDLPLNARNGEDFATIHISLNKFSGAEIPFPCIYGGNAQFFTIHADNTGEGSDFILGVDNVYLQRVYCKDEVCICDPDNPDYDPSQCPCDPNNPEYDAAYCSPCNPDGPNYDPDAEECNPDGIFTAGTDDTNIRYQNGSLLVENTTGISTVTVTDLQGRIISTDEVNGKNAFYKELNLIQGIYIVDVTNGDLTKKVIKIIL